MALRRARSLAALVDMGGEYGAGSAAVPLPGSSLPAPKLQTCPYPDITGDRMNPTSGQDEVRRDDSNVDRPAERERVAENVAGQLRQRGADVRGDESEDELANLLTAVQRFERARSERGGDSFTNTPESTRPDDP